MNCFLWQCHRTYYYTAHLYHHYHWHQVRMAFYLSCRLGYRYFPVFFAKIWKIVVIIQQEYWPHQMELRSKHTYFHIFALALLFCCVLVWAYHEEFTYLSIESPFWYHLYAYHWKFYSRLNHTISYHIVIFSL